MRMSSLTMTPCYQNLNDLAHRISSVNKLQQLDRIKISDHNAIYALASFSAAVGKTPTDLALKCCSIQRSRIKHG